ncbi:MAG: SIMPL domain-containing protein [Porticoccaceae bacterium]|nr:SIMPL domain-containing protein [Porticoccaceae bacterium]
MSKVSHFIASITLGSVLYCGIYPAMTQASEPLQGIHVPGRGEVLVVPDMVSMTFQVSRQGRDAVLLKQELDQVTQTVLELTDSLDIPRTDVTAALVNINPRSRYENKRHIIDSVTASRTIHVVLKNLDQYGPLINGSLKLGINNIGGVRLASSKRVALEQQALELAIADAKWEAKAIARQFDVRVLGVRDVRVGSHAVQPRPEGRVMSMAADSGASFSPGEMTIRRDIQVTFAIGGQ